jgi:hypothetical protein
MKPVWQAVLIAVLLFVGVQIVSVRAPRSQAVLVSYVTQWGWRSFLAVRSDGAWVQAQYSKRPDGKQHLYRNITFPDGRFVVVVNEEGLLMAERGKPPRYPSLDDPAASCRVPRRGRYSMDRRIVGIEPLHGVRTVHLQWEGGQYRTDIWEAPDLGCISLKNVLSDRVTGAAVARTEAAAVVLAEPAASWFTAPDSMR